MITGVAQMDGAIFAAVGRRWPDAADPRALAAGAPGCIPQLVVFLNKCDLVDDVELLDLIELETRDLLTKYGYDGENVVFVRGNARRRARKSTDPQFSGCIVQLLDSLDQQIEEPQRDVDKPFLDADRRDSHHRRSRNGSDRQDSSTAPSASVRRSRSSDWEKTWKPFALASKR